MSSLNPIHPQTPQDLTNLYLQKIKLALLTCYDSSFAEILVAAKLDALMVGDSLGMVIPRP